MTEKDITLGEFAKGKGKEHLPPKLLNKYIGFDESGNCTAYEVTALLFKPDGNAGTVSTAAMEGDAQLIHDYLSYKEEIGYAHEVLFEEIQDRWRENFDRYFRERTDAANEEYMDPDEWNFSDPELIERKLSR